MLGFLLLSTARAAGAQETGSIRGVVYDKDFELPLPATTVTLVGVAEVLSTDQGNYLVNDVPPGTYTLVFHKEGYARQVKAEVLVSAGRLTEVDAWLAGEFTEMDEFVVQDLLLLGGGSEAALLELRLDSPAFVDTIGSDLMSRAGASDAAGALRLVTGASVQDGKSAVIRGLPDRFVSAQLNGVRLPTADEDKRAVELDQFPASVIESLNVSKTFTPDQQGDASGGAVDIRLKGVPNETVLNVKVETGYNTQVHDAGDDFLTYEGGGVNTWGRDDGSRDPQLDRIGEEWEGAVGASREEPPQDFKWSVAGGHRVTLDNGFTVGGYASFFYERDTAYFDDGVRDSYWVTTPGGPMVPQTVTGTPGEGGDFKTQLFDIEQGTESVQWGGLGALGIENEDHRVTLSYLYTRTAEDTATIAEDTRGKSYFFPGYDPDDPRHEGNKPENLSTAPWIRLETLEYTERTTQSLVPSGHHRLPVGEWRVNDGFAFQAPEIDWFYADNKATLDSPDKRQFGGLWWAPTVIPGVPGLIPDQKEGGRWQPFRPGSSFSFGNLQRIFKTIEESSDQYGADLKLPFEQWTDDPGYFKFGIFDDDLERTFTQETYSNLNDNSPPFPGTWDEGWSPFFGEEIDLGGAQNPVDGEFDHPLTESLKDVDYEGAQRISAWYGMADVPVVSRVNVIGGARVESTDLSIVVTPEEEARWFPPGSPGEEELTPGDADVDFEREDVLPSIGAIYEPIDRLFLRASYSETVARQTFKELTPIVQQEYSGGPIFIGNPELQMASLDNYDLRADFTPYEQSFLSASWFSKDVTDPIEYVQRIAGTGFDYTTALNFPTGELTGWELEARQGLGTFVDALQGLSIGANATFIDSEVQLSEEEAATFEQPNVDAPQTSRPMTNAPEHLYNFFLTYDIETTGSQLALFYTLQGDSLVAGAATSNSNFVPDVYATQFGTLNLSFVQKLGQYFKLQFQAKNLTDPEIQTVYRSEFIEEDVLHTSFSRGIDLSVSIGAAFSF